MQRRSGVLVGVLDQGASALSNVLLPLAVARSANPVDFGFFAIAQMIYSSVLIVSRALIGEPYIVLSNSMPPRDSSVARRRLLLCQAGLGVSAGVLSTGALVLLSPSLPKNALIVLLSLPVLSIQDTLRWYAIGAGKQYLALIADSAWVLVFGTWFGASLFGVASTVPPATAWLAGCILGALAVCVPLLRNDCGVFNSPPISVAEVLRLGVPAATETGLGAIGLQVGFYATAALRGADMVGSVRGALTLLGPLGVLLAGVLQWLLPRMSGANRGAIIAAVLRVQASMVVCAVLGSIGLLFLPASIGHSLLGATWIMAREAIPAVAVYTAFTLSFMVAQAGVRARRLSHKLLRLRWVDAILIPALFSCGALMGRDPFLWAVALTGVLDLAMGMQTLTQRGSGTYFGRRLNVGARQ